MWTFGGALVGQGLARCLPHDWFASPPPPIPSAEPGNVAPEETEERKLADSLVMSWLLVLLFVLLFGVGVFESLKTLEPQLLVATASFAGTNVSWSTVSVARATTPLINGLLLSLPMFNAPEENLKQAKYKLNRLEIELSDLRMDQTFLTVMMGTTENEDQAPRSDIVA